MVINMPCTFLTIFPLLCCGGTLVPLVSHPSDFFSKKSFRPVSACRRLLLTPMGYSVWEFTGSHSQGYCSSLSWVRNGSWCLSFCRLGEKRGGFPALCHPSGWLLCYPASLCYCLLVYFWAWKRCEKWWE